MCEAFFANWRQTKHVDKCLKKRLAWTGFSKDEIQKVDSITRPFSNSQLVVTVILIKPWSILLLNYQLSTGVEVNIHLISTDIEVNKCFSIYTTQAEQLADQYITLLLTINVKSSNVSRKWIVLC